MYIVAAEAPIALRRGSLSSPVTIEAIECVLSTETQILTGNGTTLRLRYELFKLS